MVGKYHVYAKYTDSGIEWLEEIPIDWNVTRVKYASTLNPSKSHLHARPNDTEVTFLPMESIGERGELVTTRVKLLKEVRSGYTYIGEGDICIAKITPCFENGKGAVITGLKNEIAFATTEVIPLRCLRKDDAKFLYYLLTSAPFSKVAEGSMYGAGGQKRVADSFVANYHFAMPSVFERDQIANFLDHETAKIDTLIEKQQELIQLLKEKRQAVISHAVTKGLNPDAPMKPSGVEWLGDVPEHWVVCPLRYTLHIDNGPRLPINRSERAEMAGNYPYWGPTGVLDHLNHYRYEGERALIGEDGDHFRKFSHWPMTQWATGRFNVNNHAHVIASGKNCLARWFFFSFLHRDIGADLIAQGVSRLKLTREGLSLLMLVVPPIEEQLMLIKHMDKATLKISQLLFNVAKQIELLKERRTALISAAVTGKIDVRNWQAPNPTQPEEEGST